MKKRTAYFFAAGVVFLFARGAFAEDGAGQGPPAGHPCGKVVAACRAAGFVDHGAKEGKGLWKDCVGPIKHGQTVPGVTVDPADVETCKAAPEHGRRGGPPPAK